MGGRQAGSFYRRCVPGPYGCFYNTSDSGAVPVFNSVSMDRRDDQVHVCMDGVHLHRVCGKDRGTYKDNICAFLRLYLDILCNILCFGFSVICMIEGYKLLSIIRQGGQTAVSLPIPMWLLYLVMPLGFLLVCLRLVQCTVKIAGQIRQGGIEADKIEEEKGGA